MSVERVKYCRPVAEHVRTDGIANEMCMRDRRV